MRFLLATTVLVAATCGAGGEGGVAAAADGVGCDAPQRGKLEMTGDIGDYQSGVVDDPVHDPTLFTDGETFQPLPRSRAALAPVPLTA